MTKESQCQWVKKTKKTKCPICKQLFIKERQFQVTCNNFECAIAHGKKILSKQNNKEKKELNQNSKRYLLAKAQEVFNKFIRMRDENEHCISCGFLPYYDKKGNYVTRQWHASHYRPAGRNEELRFNEENVHKACSICNKELSGNLTPYRIALVQKIGLEKVELLESCNNVKKFTIEELKEIIKKYKLKLKG